MKITIFLISLTYLISAYAEMDKKILACHVPSWNKNLDFYVQSNEWSSLLENKVSFIVAGKFNQNPGYTPVKLAKVDETTFVVTSSTILSRDKFTFNTMEANQEIHVTQKYDGVNYDYDMVCEKLD